MNEYIAAIIYIMIGASGAVCHYLKKRYIDNTTTVSLIHYLTGEPRATANAIFFMIGAEITLSYGGWPIGLHALIGALTVGYTCDSACNKAPENGDQI